MKQVLSSPFLSDEDADFEFYKYDKNGNQITLLNREEYWIKQFDQNKRVIAFENSKGYWSNAIFNQQGNLLTFINSKGDWTQCKYTYKDIPNGTLWQQTVLRH